ncbi:hypothetical protein IC582_010800 [Cucumis melo]
MEFTISDDLLGTFVPIFVYWFYSGLYLLLGFFDNYRLHSKTDEDEKNLVSKSTVVRGVLFQQFIQAIVAIILFKLFVVHLDYSFTRLNTIRCGFCCLWTY